MMRLIAILALAACAHAPLPPSPLWEICRDACRLQGAWVAGVVGRADASDHPQCICAARPEGS